MSKVPRKSAWRSLTKLLFCTSVVALILFNAFGALGHRSMSQSIEQTQSELDTRGEQMKILQPIANQYYNECLPEFEDMEVRMNQIRNQLHAQDKLFPILDHEFVITKIDGDYGSGERTIFISVPKSGKHRMRIQTTLRNETLMDQQFDLVSGRGYRMKFTLADSKLHFLFPDEEPARLELDDFAFANKTSNLRNSLAGSQTFVSSNQPRWTLKSSLKTEEYGVLTQFAFMSDLLDPKEHLSIKITAESDGPPIAAADDTATVLHLDSLLRSGWEPEFRFEDGRYIFER